MKILVAYRATSGGADAVALGARLARTLGAGLELVMVLPPDRVLPMTNYQELLAGQAHQWLAEAAAKLPDDLEVATTVCYSDSATEGLLAEAERVEAAAIVAGGSGGGLVGRHSMGPVVNELLHASPVPVALAPRGIRRSSVTRLREITCAVGHRPGAGDVLETAVCATDRGDVPLRLVSLIALDIHGHGHGGKESMERADRAREHAERLVADVRTQVPDGIPVSWSVVDGRNVEEAVDKLDWQEGDIVFVASSRLAQPLRLFLGSTAAKMLRVLEVPMVVVPRTS